MSGSAGSPAQATVIGKPVLVVCAIALPVVVLRPLPAPSGRDLPRGPPLKPTAI